MKRISQRQLRNENAAIMSAVEAGEVYTVTRRGIPVARLGPVNVESDLRCVRPATSRPVFARLPRVASEVSTEEILADLRGER